MDLSKIINNTNYINYKNAIKKLAQTICLQGPNNQLIFIRVKNEVETQQRQQQTIILPEHQQSIILPQQQESFTLSQPQQQLLFLQQPQSEQPLLLLQQQNQQQSLILLQQPEQEEDQVYKPVIVLQQSQQHQQQDLIVKTEEINQNVKNELQPSELVDSDRPISILPVIKSVQQKTVRNIRNSKPNVRIISNTLKISKSDVVEVNGLEKNQDDALIKSQFSSIQERTLGAAESTFSSQDFPSTSEENAKNFQETDNLSEGYFNDLVKEDSKYNFDVDDMQDIYGRKDDGSYCCNICQITRVDRRSILSHISGQHSHLRPHKCIICDKTFKRKYSLKVHELSHNVKSSIKAFSCDKCDYCTPNKVSLRYHKYRVHTNEYRFTCEHCGKRYKMKRELADHLVTHSGVQHICDICGKLYRGEHLLRAHRRLHLDLYKFQCAVCKKKLSTERSLSNHLKLHNRTYECDECSMKFPSKYNLIKHRNVHTREQAYTCPECGKIFADRATQKVHSLMHAGIKPYRCNVCGAGFTQRSPMMLHWRKKHPGETDPPPPVILKNILKSIKEQNGTKVLPIDE